MNWPLLFAAILDRGVDPSKAGPGSHLLSNLKGPALVLLAIIPLVIVLIVWVLAGSRKRRRRKRRSYHRMTPDQSRALVHSWRIMRESRGRKRRRHGDHRPTNPTLAETGGLPPRRPKDTPPNSQGAPPPAEGPMTGNVRPTSGPPPG